MKFSYSYLKKLVPSIKNVAELSDKLTMGLFEIDGVEGDTMDIKVLPNRYSDAASYLGLAREIAAFYGKKFAEPKSQVLKPKAKEKISVTIKDKTRCRRASAWYFEGITIGPSPKWMQEVLSASGMRPINNIVDITNFVMLLTGQPLHAFDYDLMDSGELIIRRAHNQEKIVTLDNREFVLDPEVLVLADRKDALDVAGIKGGKKAEVTSTTSRILLTACSFDGISIYKTQRKLNLMTDASLRFAHHLSAELTYYGITHAAELIVKLCGGLPGKLCDVRIEKSARRSVKLDDARINKLLGTSISRPDMVKILSRIGFSVKGNLVTVPQLRVDVETVEDLAEEIARFYGYERIKPAALYTDVAPKFSDSGMVEFADFVRDAFQAYGYDEVYNYSFINSEDAQEKGYLGLEGHELLNPISEEQTHLRTTLVSHLRKTLRENLKSFDSVKVFEIGKTYHKSIKEKSLIHEVETLGVALSLSSRKGLDHGVFELKGVINNFLTRLGCTDVFFVEIDSGTTPALQSVRIEVNQKNIGYLGVLSKDMCVAELDLTLLYSEISEEREYKPVSKFPAIIRDISLLVPASIRIGKIIEAIENSNSVFISDVDLVDEYRDLSWKDKQSLTFRIVFQSEDRTLTGDEVDAEIKSICGTLQTAFNAEIR